jgi:hypothetical protein
MLDRQKTRSDAKTNLLFFVRERDGSVREAMGECCMELCRSVKE